MTGQWKIGSTRHLEERVGRSEYRQVSQIGSFSPGELKRIVAALNNDSDRLSAAREGAVKALNNWILLNFDGAVDIDWNVSEAGFSECYFDLRDAASAALEELEEAQRA